MTSIRLWFGPIALLLFIAGTLAIGAFTLFVLPAHRGKGHGKALMAAVFDHPKLQGLRRFSLATSDAHGLYAQFGFTVPRRPETLMERTCQTSMHDHTNASPTEDR